jgi:ribonuclease HI
MSFKRGSYDPFHAIPPAHCQMAKKSKSRSKKPKRAKKQRYVSSSPQEPMDFTIYCDGGCFPNPGPGGWGFVCCETNAERCGGEKSTTNNRMEITAALEAMRHHRSVNGEDKSLRIVSDSQYVVRACSNWITKWKKNNWTKSDGQLKNVDLWQQVDAEMLGLTIHFEWIKGHNGSAFNERADELAAIGAMANESLD